VFPDPSAPKRRIPCVGALVNDDDGRLLVVRRGTEPGRGLWSVPGGRVEPGESDGVAVEREVLEETGLHVTVGIRVGTVVRDGPAGSSYDIRDYACAVTGPTSPRCAG
jgi:8-oxo-dGTP diphosphatase